MKKGVYELHIPACLITSENRVRLRTMARSTHYSVHVTLLAGIASATPLGEIIALFLTAAIAWNSTAAADMFQPLFALQNVYILYTHPARYGDTI